MILYLINALRFEDIVKSFFYTERLHSPWFYLQKKLKKDINVQNTKEKEERKKEKVEAKRRPRAKPLDLHLIIF